MEKCANCRYFQPDSSGEGYCTLQDCNVGWNRPAVPILKRTKADSERRNTYETMSGM